MANFENTEDDYIQRRVEELVQRPRLAQVQEVTTRELDEKKEGNSVSNVECDVITRTGEQHLRRVPVMTSATGNTNVPQVDDTVVVIEFAGRGQRNIIIGTVHTTSKRAPIAEEGDIKYKRGNLVFKIDGDGRHVRIFENGNPEDSIGEAEAFLEVKDSVQGTVININSDSQVTVRGGNVTVDSENVKLGDVTDEFRPVAREGDTIDGTTGEIIASTSNVESS